ncbi:MAG: phage tail tube protein [Jatrophihabitans sp.]|uniref:phage tail tube protein n=1 Tax=Jatrophihabitans sp. TaxID=1932789 RepID=UPI003F7F3146
MSINIYPSNLQWVGIAKETTYGTPVAAPTAWIPVDGSSIKFKPNLNVLKDQAFRGQMSQDFAAIPGMIMSSLDYKAYLYLDSVYQHFLAILGKTDTVTGSADPYTHKTSLENGAGNAQAQPPSYTLFWFDGVTAWQLPGCVASDVKLDIKTDELAAITVSWMGMPAVKLGSPPANTPSTAVAIPSWNSTITLGGSASTAYSSVSLEYKRDAAAVQTIAGTQSPQRILSATFSVTGTLTAVYQGGAPDANMTDYLTNVQPALVVKCAPVGDAVHSISLQHSVCVYDGVDPQGSNKWMEIQASVTALANATDALDSKTSPAQAILVTSVSTPY